MDSDLSITWSARSIPQLRGVARHEYDRVSDYFLAVTAVISLMMGCLLIPIVKSAKAFFYFGLLLFVGVVFAVVAGRLAAAVLNSGYDYRLNADGLAVRPAGFPRLLACVGVGVAFFMTRPAKNRPEKIFTAATELSRLSSGISWTELAGRGAALEVIPDERAVILHEPWGRWVLLEHPPLSAYLFCETDERLVEVLKLIRQCLPGIEEQAASPSRWRRRLRITAIVFMLTGIVGSVVC